MTRIDHESLPRPKSYAVRFGADDRPHMFNYESGMVDHRFIRDDNSTWLEKSYILGTVYFNRNIFQDWIQKPKEITDTFEMFGRSWIVIEDWGWGYQGLKCVPETIYSHSLALYMLRWHLDMGMWLCHTVRPLARQIRRGGGEEWMSTTP